MIKIRDLRARLRLRKEAGRDFDALFATGYRRLARLLYRDTGDFGRAEEVASEARFRFSSQDYSETKDSRSQQKRSELPAAGLRNQDRAQQLARLTTTVPALLFSYPTPYHFVGVREVSMRSGSATLIEEFGLAGPEDGFGYSDGVPGSSASLSSEASGIESTY